MMGMVMKERARKDPENAPAYLEMKMDFTDPRYIEPLVERLAGSCKNGMKKGGGRRKSAVRRIKSRIQKGKPKGKRGVPVDYQCQPADRSARVLQQMVFSPPAGGVCAGAKPG